MLIDTDLYLGTHVEFSGKQKLYNILTGDITDRCNCYQIFLGSPQRLDDITKLDKNDMVSCSRVIRDFDLRLFCHHSFVANYAMTDVTMARKRLKWEVDVIKTIAEDRGGVVLHPGSASCIAGKDKKVALDKIIENLSSMEHREYIYIENCAEEGSKICSTMEEIYRISREIPDIKFCLDTCHCFGSGLCRFKNRLDTFELLDGFDRLIGFSRLGCIHLNDSKEGYKSRKDRHERLGKGCIWSKNTEGLEEVIKIASNNKIPLIGEGSIDLDKDISWLRKMIV